MPDDLEFIIKAKNELSGEMRQASTSAQRSLSDIDKSASQTQRKLDEVARSAANLKKELSAMGSGANYRAAPAQYLPGTPAKPVAPAIATGTASTYNGVAQSAAQAAKQVDQLDKSANRANRDIASGARSAQRSIQGNTHSIEVMNRKLSMLETRRRLSIDTSDIRSATREINALEKKRDTLEGLGRSGGGMGRLGRGVAIAGMGLALAGGYGMARVGASSLEQGMDVQRQIVGLSTFVGDRKADAIYNQLQQQAVHTPFTSSQLLQAERGILPYKSPQRANKDVMSLANAVAGTGGSDYTMERMGWHMQQMAATGKMEGIQAREFGFASIPIYKLLADAFMPKMDTKKAQEKLKGMDISYDMVSVALAKAAEKGGMFAGAMEKLSQTIYGKWTTIKDFWQIGQAKLTLSQSDNIKRIEDMAIGGLQRIPEIVAKMEPVVSRVFDIAQEMWPSIREFGGSLIELLRPIGRYLISDNFKELGKSVIGAAGKIANTLAPALDALITVVNELTPAIKWIVDHTVGSLDKANPARQRSINALGAQWSANGGVSQLQPGKSLAQLFATPVSKLSGHMAHYSKDDLAKLQNNKSARDLAKAKGYGAASDMNPSTTMSDKGDKIIGGGRRPINVTIGKFMDDFIINAKEMKEGADQTRQMFIKMFLEVLQSANALQG